MIFSFMHVVVGSLVASAAAPVWGYPTHLTTGVIPKRIHSSSDCWQDTPLFSAIAAGAISVEADIWVRRRDLLIGQNKKSLSEHRTFSSLYVTPLLDILRQQNPSGSFSGTSGTRNGIFSMATQQTFYLYINIKSDGDSAWPLVIKQLTPLREGGWLSYWDEEAGILRSGAVTVIGTGNAPFSQILSYSTRHRDVFYAAPITAFTLGHSKKYDCSTVVVADGSFVNSLGGPMSGDSFTDTDVKSLINQVESVHAAGIKVRYWGTPDKPVSKRDYVWKMLMAIGVDLLDVDDLNTAADLPELKVLSAEPTTTVRHRNGGTRLARSWAGILMGVFAIVICSGGAVY